MNPLATAILFGCELAHNCERDGHPSGLYRDGRCEVCEYWKVFMAFKPIEGV